MTVEADQMAGLLTAEDGVLPPKGLEHVAVAHVRGHDADPVIGHQPVEAEVGHHGDNDRVDLKVEREDLRIWSPSTISPAPSTASMRSPSPSKATPRSAPAPTTCSCNSLRSVAPQPTLMFVPSGLSASGRTSASSRSNAEGAIPE